MLVSVVVPFHGVEAFIGRCLDSVSAQTYPDLEILCVDDASPDGSRGIAEAHARADRRVRIIHHAENRGLGGARNSGIAAAEGALLCFVDSDDYLAPGHVRELHDALAAGRADIAVCNFLQDVGGVLSPYGGNYVAAEFPLDPGKCNALEVAMRFNPGCTNKMYRTGLVRRAHLAFPEHRYYEDVLFWLRAVHCSRAVASTPGRNYVYRQRAGSIMATLTRRHIDDRIAFIAGIDRFVKSAMLPACDGQRSRVLDDARAYILRHLRYGEHLVDAAPEGRDALRAYYRERIAAFAREHGWSDLDVA